MIEQAAWLEGIVGLSARRELALVAGDANLLRKAIVREIANINAGLGQEVIQLEAA